ncbi:tetratricopeptide repeat protein [Verrucomicrobia bacterium S94]|nr:tetratricopeptide repeat protein [Verrucomicrobia bacterium S94]
MKNISKYCKTTGFTALLFCGGMSVADEMQDFINALPDMSDIRKPPEKMINTKPKKVQDLSIWDEEMFQKQFMASYGVNTDIEPKLTAVEYEQMQKVLDAMSEEDDTEKAEKLLLKNCKDSSSATFEFTLANIYFQQDRLDEALTYYDRAIAQFPNFRRAYKNAGLIHVRNGDFEKALPYLTKTIELGGHTAIAYGLLGFAYGSTGNHLCAESAYRQAILLDPETIDWQLGLARSFFKQQKFGDAVSLCNTLIKTKPDNADFWLLQANAYLGLKQPMRAAENYEYVNALGKSTPESMTMLGDIYVNEERWDMAADAYLRAYELNDGAEPEKALRAAKILAARGSLEQSVRILNRVSERKTSLDKDNLKELLKLQARVAVAGGEGGMWWTFWRKWWRSIRSTARPLFCLLSTMAAMCRKKPFSTMNEPQPLKSLKRKPSCTMDSCWWGRRNMPMLFRCCAAPMSSSRVPISKII